MKRTTEKNIHDSKVLERPVRKAVNMPTRLILGDQTYDGFVVNISARGVGMFLNTAFNENIINCQKGTILTLELQSILGETISLECVIQRLRIQKCSKHDLITNIGMEVVAPPNNFVTMFESLC
jgi:hypothetical protein